MSTSISQMLKVGGHGEVAGSATAKQCPSVAAKMVNFKAPASNAGNVYIGLSSAVTVPAGTDTETAGWELAAGEETGYLPTPDGSVDDFWIICDNPGDDLLFMALVS